MSHVSEIDVKVKSLDALKAACARLGFQFVEGQRSYEWYGRYMRDYPLPAGVKVEDLGRCDHAIKVPGAKYEVGIVDNGNGEFSLRYDFWASGGLDVALGKGAGLLKQAYAIEQAKIAARRRGFSCYEQPLEDGKIELTLRRAE